MFHVLVKQYREHVDNHFDWTDPADKAEFNKIMAGIEYIHICAGPDPVTKRFWVCIDVYLIYILG